MTVVDRKYNEFSTPAIGMPGLTAKGAVVESHRAGEAIPFGTFVSIKNDGTVVKTDTSNTDYIGVAMWNSTASGTGNAYAQNDAVSVLTFGYVVVESVTGTNAVTEETDDVNLDVNGDDLGKITKQATQSGERIDAKAKAKRFYSGNKVAIFVNTTG